MKKILFITWDGAKQGYVQSLFVPIFVELRKKGYAFEIMQFTWADQEERGQIKKVAEENGIPFVSYFAPVRFKHLSTLAMMLGGAFLIWRYCREKEIGIVMPRSTIPAAMTLLAKILLSNIRVVFDADGFMQDERVDFAGWSESGFTYRFFRWIEAAMTKQSWRVLTRSEFAKVTLLKRSGGCCDDRSVFVVGNGRDEAQFQPFDAGQREKTRQMLGIPLEAPLIVYAGGLGVQYCPEEMAAFFSHVIRFRPEAHLLVLSAQTKRLEPLLVAKGLQAHCHFRYCAPSEVPSMLALGDLGLAFRRQTFSMKAVFPIKIGEYLLCGLPVISTTGIGDIDLFLRGSQEAFLMEHLEDSALVRAAEWFVNFVLPNRESCRRSARETGLKYFSLNQTVDQYAAAFQACEE